MLCCCWKSSHGCQPNIQGPNDAGFIWLVSLSTILQCLPWALGINASGTAVLWCLSQMRFPLSSARISFLFSFIFSSTSSSSSFKTQVLLRPPLGRSSQIPLAPEHISVKTFVICEGTWFIQTGLQNSLRIGVVSYWSSCQDIQHSACHKVGFIMCLWDDWKWSCI